MDTGEIKIMNQDKKISEAGNTITGTRINTENEKNERLHPAVITKMHQPLTLQCDEAPDSQLCILYIKAAGGVAHLNETCFW